MLKVTYLAHLLLSAFLIRLLVTGASVGDSIGLFALVALNGLSLYIDFKREPEVNKDIKDRLASLEEKLNKQEGKIGALTLRR